MNHQTQTITIYGAGYVGLVTGCCFADAGYSVCLVDIDPARIQKLQRGQSPIYEPGLTELLQRHSQTGKLTFTSDLKAAVQFGYFQFIAVGTPSCDDGSADLQYVLNVAHSIGTHLEDYRVIIDKSTVPVGTAEKVKATITKTVAARGVTVPFDVVSNPEFLKEGAAIRDFMQPDRIVVGADHPEVFALMQQLYAPFLQNPAQFVTMDVRSAELTKYAANAMLATKISFINEVSQIAEAVGADIEAVREGIGLDSRIGPHFIRPGCGYGGSCFPKDVRALIRTAKTTGIDPALLETVDAVNERQKHVLFQKIERYFKHGLQGKRFAVLGLAFKPDTDDMREASSRVLIEALWQAGAIVQAYDPVAIPEARRLYGQRDDFILCDQLYDTLHAADALVIVTEWAAFRDLNFTLIKQSLNYPIIFDGRNLFHGDDVTSHGLVYDSIGRTIKPTTGVQHED